MLNQQKCVGDRLVRNSTTAAAQQHRMRAQLKGNTGPNSCILHSGLMGFWSLPVVQYPKKHNVSETRYFSVVRVMGGMSPAELVPLDYLVSIIRPVTEATDTVVRKFNEYALKKQTRFNTVMNP